MTTEAKILITGDSSQAEAAIGRVKTAAAGMGESFRQAGGAGVQSAKALNAALRTVPAQITDIVVGLSSGQAPMTVLLQQGGQLKDVFGGIGPAAKAVGGYILGLVNPYTLAAAAAAGLGAAFLAGSNESTAFARAIILSGNAANTSVSRLQDLARNVAEATGATQGRAAEVLAGLVEQGKFTEDQLGRVAAAAIAMERATGQSAEKTVASFELIGKSPAEALEKLDKAQNFLTASTYEQVRALIEQGRSTEASRVLAEAYANTIKTRSDEIIQNQGLIERGWNAIKEATAGAIDSAKTIGRADTLQQQLEDARRNLDLINSGAIIGDAGLAQSAIADLEKRVALEAQTNQLKAEQNKLQAQQKEFIELTAIATDKSAVANTELLNKLKAGYLATMQAIAAANPGKDPLNTAAGIIATEKYLAKISEIAQEVNKVGIAGETALREKLNSAMEDGREKAGKLKEEIAALNGQIAQNLAGQGNFAQKAQALRDKNLTPEQADAKNAAAARNALDEAQKLALYAQNAAIDGRAKEAQDYAGRATKLLDEAGKAADKLNDSEFAAKLFDQLGDAQTQLLQGQKAIKEQALADTEAQTESQAQQLAALEERLAALKSGASVKVEIETDAALAQAKAFAEALAAIPRRIDVEVNYVSSGPAPSGDQGIPAPDAPARAYGGVLPGRSAHDRADDMLYWGTAGEYVVQRPIMRQPMALAFMHEFNRVGMAAVRNWRLPRHAFGGQLGAGFIEGLRVPSVSAPSDRGGDPLQPIRLTVPGVGEFPVMTRQDVAEEMLKVFNRAKVAAGRR